MKVLLFYLFLDWECPSIFHGTPITDRRSTFQPHLAQVFHKSQVFICVQSILALPFDAPGKQAF